MSEMKETALFGLLAVLALFASFPFDAALARIEDHEEIREPDDPADLTAVQVAGPFEFPWSIAFLPNGSTLLTEVPGRLQLILPGSVAREVAGLPAILRKDLAGLLDVAVDPSFSENRTVYLSYVHGTAVSSTIRVLRAKLDDQSQTLLGQQVIFESTPPGASAEQLGGRIVVTDDGHLFLTLGDRWKPERAQDLSDHAGSIIRIRTDGSVPKNNPFVSVAGAMHEIGRAHV